MAKFTVHTHESAPDDAHDVLVKVEDNYGFIPNLLGVLAEAPVAAEAYLSLIDFCIRSSMTPTERHVVWFAVNYEHDCNYCMAAHTAVAKKEDVSADVIEATRNGIPYQDARLEVLRGFTRDLVVRRGVVGPEAVDVFIEAGFTKRNVLEIIMAISAKVLSNYTNHVAGTPLDGVFSACAWQRPA